MDYKKIAEHVIAMLQREHEAIADAVEDGLEPGDAEDLLAQIYQKQAGFLDGLKLCGVVEDKDELMDTLVQVILEAEDDLEDEDPPKDEPAPKKKCCGKCGSAEDHPCEGEDLTEGEEALIERIREAFPEVVKVSRLIIG